jgi:hypothetical protein
MLQDSHSLLAKALVSAAFVGLASLAVAQDQPRHDDQQPPDQQQRPEQPAPDQGHHNVRPGHGAQVRDGDQTHHDQQVRDDQSRADEHHGEASADEVARYHRAHPHSAARCHDGFFTNTTDRARACSKHGGIDVWLGA